MQTFTRGYLQKFGHFGYVKKHRYTFGQDCPESPKALETSLAEHEPKDGTAGAGVSCIFIYGYIRGIQCVVIARSSHFCIFSVPIIEGLPRMSLWLQCVAFMILPSILSPLMPFHSESGIEARCWGITSHENNYGSWPYLTIIVRWCTSG